MEKATFKLVYSDTVAQPTFSPAAGTYKAGQKVTITSTTTGATIRYTTDGTDPGPSAGTVYADPISTSSDTTFRAIALLKGQADSAIASSAYLFTPAPPTLSAVAPGLGSATATWDAVTGALSYNLYWAKGATVDTGTGTKVSGAVSPQVVGGLADGTQYAFIVSAVGANGEGSPSASQAATTYNQAGGSVTVTEPGANIVTITGTSALHFGTVATFTSTYSGSASSYQWFLNGAALASQTAATLSITPSVSTFKYGANWLTLSVKDTSGVGYSGTLLVDVSN
ncbi:MAG: chitobiase/beta-hexosaminidase C-terminal domain-containing protein [Spirochaetota bacterium]